MTQRDMHSGGSGDSHHPHTQRIDMTEACDTQSEQRLSVRTYLCVSSLAAIGHWNSHSSSPALNPTVAKSTTHTSRIA